MSADGKVTIEVDLDASPAAKKINDLGFAIDLNKEIIRKERKELKRLNDELSKASPSAAKKLEFEIKAANAQIDSSKAHIAEWSAEYRELLDAMVSVGAASKESLGMTYANISNPNMPTPRFGDLVSSGKVNVSDMQAFSAAMYNATHANEEFAKSEADVEKATTAKGSVERQDIARVNALKEKIAEYRAEQMELAEAMSRVAIAYKSGKMSDEDAEEAKWVINELASEYRLASVQIERCSNAIDGMYTKESILDSKFSGESAAVEILTSSLKSLSSNRLHDSTLAEDMRLASAKVTAQLNREAMAARNAKAEDAAAAREAANAAREAANAERIAKGRITGTLGLLGMINPAFTRLSYAVRQFALIGGKSFTDVESSIKGFGAKLKALPPQAKAALGATAAVVATTTASIIAMAKALQRVGKAFKLTLTVAKKAGSAFAKFYDFDTYFGSVDTMLEAYNDFNAKEVALESLMRSRMGATDEAVESIKNLISAEEQAGVVSKKLQTASLQQLSAYVTETNSLETLLPVLNDYTMQMYGVDATEKQAESAAKLFGKAMKGQTETLRRAGYVTEEQATAIKNAGSETERAALLADYMSQRCANMNEVLAQTDAGQQRKLANSMEEVQREFGEAVSTLKTAFIPVATRVLAVMARLATYAAALANSIAKLFGSQSALAAGTVSEVEDVTDAVEEAGEAASDMNNTLGIDELNILDQGDSGSSSSDDSGIDNDALSASSGLVQKVSADLDSLIAKLKDAYTAGYLFGTTMKTALEAIPWSSIQEGAKKAGTAVAEFANGIIDSGVISQMGTTIGEALNTVIYAIQSFATTFNWGGLGKEIGNAINNMFLTINWKALGDTVGKLFTGVLNTLNTVLETINWDNIGKSVADFLTGINWAKVLGEVLRTIVNALAFVLIDFPTLVLSAVTNTLNNIVNNIADYFLKHIDAAGGNIVKGILNGIVDAIAGLGKWIYTYLLKPFITHIKTNFSGAASQFLSVGKSIITGISNGIKSAISGIKTVVTNVKNTIVNVFKTVSSSLKSIFTTAWSSIKSVFSASTIKKFFNGVISNIKGCFSSIANWFKTTFTTAWTNVKNVFSKGGKVFTGIKDGILSGLKKVINALITGINKVVATPFNGLNDALNSIRNVSIFGAKPFSGLWKEDPIPVPQIPKLATGAVLPANKPFLAMVGDQKQGTNVEAPLTTIQEAVANVMNPYLARLVELAEDIDNKDFNTYIGDIDIARANKRGSKKLGVTLRTT